MRYDFNVIVNAGAPSVSREGFGTILLVGTKEDVDFQVLYSLKDYEGEKEESNIYKSLQNIFSQKPAPSKVLVRGVEGGSVEDIIVDVTKETDDFFFITTAEIPDSIEEEIKYIETLEKVFIGSVGDVDKLVSLAETGYENTAIVYDNIGASNALSAVMSFNVGGKTAHAKPLLAVDPSNVDNQTYSKVMDNNGNLYIRRNHKNRIVGGKVLSGQWLDVVLGKYWIKFTLEQRLDDLMTNVDKVPFTNHGVGMITGVVSTVMSESIDRGIVNDFDIDIKDVNDISPSEQSQRMYNYITVTADLQGAIHGGNPLTINLIYKGGQGNE